MKKASLFLFTTLALAFTAFFLAAQGASNASARSADQAATATPVSTEANLPYKNPTLPVAERVADLLARMTLDEKIGQMALVEKNSILNKDIADLGIGGLLSGGGGYPGTENTAQAWAVMVDGFQKAAMQTRLGIPLIYGVDAVHGHNNVVGATIFPHNIGLGAANDPKLVEKIGQAVAQEMIATGIYWNYAPVVAVVQDIRWGRTYESFGENTDLVTALSSAYVIGLQGQQLGAPGTVLATPKHFIGDGGTKWGSSTSSGYRIDRGVTDVDEATLRKLFLPPYAAVVKDGALSIMASFSSWGGLKMHAQRYLLTDVLKGELDFKGFIVSDWAGVGEISPDVYTAIVTAVNAGIDMNMVPSNYTLFITTLKQAVTKGDVSVQRIDDAAARILTAKFTMGLFEHPFSDPALLSSVGSPEHRALAREAVSKSLVLLKNDKQTLPLTKKAGNLFVAGLAANDIGMQSGGWTIEWQGKMGNITPGTSLLDAIRKTVSSDTLVTYDASGQFADVKDSTGSPLKADLCIVGIGERPYAEGQGDSSSLAPAGNVKMVAQMRDRCARLVVVVFSGRPVIITNPLKQADALVAAWLPGTEGQGITDGLFGGTPFTGKLPFTWPRSAKQLPFDFSKLPDTGCDTPLFPYGFGLDTAQQTTYQDTCNSSTTP